MKMAAITMGIILVTIAIPNVYVKGRRHAVPESEANDLNVLLDVLRCANSEAVQLRFEADSTVQQVKLGEYIVAISLTEKQF
jgi:hypothetical protein